MATVVISGIENKTSIESGNLESYAKRAEAHRTACIVRKHKGQTYKKNLSRLEKMEKEKYERLAGSNVCENCSTCRLLGADVKKERFPFG